MNIRTITQLPEITSDLSGCYMEMSSPLDQSANPRYASKKVKYDTIFDDITNYISNDMVKTYCLRKANASAVNVSSMANDVQQMKNGNYAINLNKWMCISADFPPNDNPSRYGNNYDYLIPNMKTVRSIVTAGQGYISTTSSYVAEGNPLPFHSSQSTLDSVPEGASYSSTIQRGKFYFWQIDEGMRDSSQHVYDANSGSISGYTEIRDTGNLVMWGWLEEQQEPEPEQCWVALYAKLKCENDDDTQTFDIPIQVQPWIRGKNSSTLQYVGFNVPVMKGLKLKVVTGFNVGNRSSGFQNSGSLTFKDSGITNAFFGYVIK